MRLIRKNFFSIQDRAAMPKVLMPWLPSQQHGTDRLGRRLPSWRIASIVSIIFFERVVSALQCQLDFPGSG